MPRPAYSRDWRTLVSALLIVAFVAPATSGERLHSPHVHPASTNADNPSAARNIATIVLTNLVLLLATTRLQTNSTGPVTIPASILIPEDRPIVTIGDGKFTGSVTKPEVPKDLMIDPNSKAGTITIPGPISCVSVKIPQIDWGPKLGGALRDNGPL